MSGEGNEPVVEEIHPDKAGKYPETVPWDKYVGIKEAWGKSKEKVASLEGRLKSAISAEEHSKLKQELEETKAKAKTASDELGAEKEKSLSGMRGTLIKRGVPEDKVKAMSDKELGAAIVVLEHSKPGADMGGGGGASPLAGKSPRALAELAYSKK